MGNRYCKKDHSTGDVNIVKITHKATKNEEEWQVYIVLLLKFGKKLYSMLL